MTVLELVRDQADKADRAHIGGRLRGLAREMSSLSTTQPHFRSRLEDIQKELKSIGSLLRGTE